MIDGCKISLKKCFRYIGVWICFVCLSGSSWATNKSSVLNELLKETEAICERESAKAQPVMRSIRVYSDSLICDDNISRDSLIVDVANRIATGLNESRLYNLTIEYTKMACRVLHKNVPEGKMRAKAIIELLLIQASAYQDLGLHSPSVNNYFFALEQAKKYDLTELSAVVYNNLGTAFQRQGKYEKSDSLLIQAIQINEQRKDKQKLFINYNNLAVSYAKRENHTKALEYAFLALHQLDPQKDKDMEQLMKLSIASIYLNHNEPLMALKMVREVKENQELSGQKNYLFYTYRLLTNIYLKQNRMDMALETLQQVNWFMDFSYSDKEWMDMLQMYAKTYALKQDYARAYTYLVRADAVKDSLADIEIKHQLANIEEMYLAGQERLRQELVMQEEERRNNRLIYYVLAAVIVVLTVIIVVVYRKSVRSGRAKDLQLSAAREEQETIRVRKEAEKEDLKKQIAQYQEELQRQKKMLVSFSIQSVQNESYMEKLNEEIKKILLEINMKDTEKKKHVKQIISEINQYTTGSRWDEFRYRFENVHESFFRNLSEACADLTVKDLHMCALLRLGLSTKEIAAITFKEVRSIESSRNRLRKKLGLSEKEDLLKYLSGF